MSEKVLPRIAILMAVYEPNMDWLRQQLDSLNAQTYPNISLYVCNDASPKRPHEEIAGLVRERITAFPVTILRNEKNLGSNLTFQRLTEEAEGALFAFCDQDDVWMPEKLTLMQEAMEREQALLVCSDMLVIDADGKKLADSITELRRHIVYRSGTGLAPGLLTRNFISGCAMLVDASCAREAVPFCPYMVHDQHLGLFCASRGKIVHLDKPTIRYRLHGSNQTGVMTGVKDKKSYGRERIDLLIRRMVWLKKYFPADEALAAEIEKNLNWALARRAHWNTGRKAAELWRYRDCGRMVTLFELGAVYFPEPLFMGCITLAKKNII